MTSFINKRFKAPPVMSFVLHERSLASEKDFVRDDLPKYRKVGQVVILIRLLA